jgi:methionyl-tRNA synthetase
VAKDTLYLTTPPCPPTRPPDLDLALEAVGADVYARAHRQQGHEVRLVAACLEQGRAVAHAAYERGGTPQDLADQWTEQWRAALRALDVACDDFTRTTEPRHQRVVKAFFLKLFDHGDIYKGVREGLYCARCRGFREGQDVCSACGGPLDQVSEEAYFLRTEKHLKRVQEYLESHEDFIQPVSLRDEIVDALAEGMADPCISRMGLDWALPVPIDPEHAIAVWFDALISYLTTSGYLAEPQMFERYWPPALQVVAPEGLRSHALSWLVVLAAAGLPFPKRLVVRGGLQVDEDSLPSGAGDPAALATRLGSDTVRYALLRAVDFTAGTVLSFQRILQLRDDDLVGRLAWLVDLTRSAIAEHREGLVPRSGPVRAPDEPLVAAAAGLAEAAGAAIEAMDFGGALGAVWDVADLAIDYAAKAGLVDDDDRPRRLDSVLYNLAETCRLLGHNLAPFLPAVARAIASIFPIAPGARAPAELGHWGLLPPATPVGLDEPLLPHLDGDLPPHGNDRP